MDDKMYEELQELFERGEEFTFRDFTNWVKEGIRTVGETFTEPDDDWMAIAFFVCKDPAGSGKEALAIMPLFDMNDKDKLAQIQVAFAEQSEARLFGMVSSAWMLSSRVEEGESEAEERRRILEEGGSISEHPDRIEAVFVNVMDRERQEFWHAKILRDGEQAPVLTEWEEPAIDVSGRFVDDMKEALR